MELADLKKQVIKMALEGGAVVAGVGDRQRLKDAPPSADVDYDLQGAQSFIIWAYAVPRDVLKNYLSKAERFSFKNNMHFAYSQGWKTAVNIAGFIEKNTAYKAIPVIPNAGYRNDQGSLYKQKRLLRAGIVLLKLGIGKRILTRIIARTFGQKAIPRFSLRYGAVAAGLGHLGWSGNLLVKNHGATVYLAGALTTAPLESDAMNVEHTCNKCKICVRACPTGLFSMDETEEPVTIGGQQEIFAKRNTYARCYLGCGGLAGLGEGGAWSTWTPDHLCLKEIPEEKMNDQGYREELIYKLLFAKETPRAQKEFNKAILIQFMRTGIAGNAGLRDVCDAHPTCGVCQAICVDDPKSKTELFSLLKSSGKMFVDDSGREYIKKIDESGKETVYYPAGEDQSVPAQS
jgi:ferredoxin